MGDLTLDALELTTLWSDFCFDGRTERVLGPEHGKFCIVLLNTQCEEVPMK
jgi:hypothetical protein